MELETKAQYSNVTQRQQTTSQYIAESLPNPIQEELLTDGFPLIVNQYPQLRFMGSKHRLLPWIHKVLSDIPFNSVIDAFSGSGCVAYMFKAMQKQVTTNDFLNLNKTVSRALIENAATKLSGESLNLLLSYDPHHKRFIEQTFSGIFYTPKDLRFLDLVSWNIQKLNSKYEKAIALAALIRSCVKRQPRGVFTVAGDLNNYDDGRRDLRLSLKEHFLEQVEIYNNAVFKNGQKNKAHCGDIFSWNGETADLVYMDPPYVPRADDNCYMKRYHFLEGLSCYWKNKTIMHDSRVKKIEKPHTPFSYRRMAVDAFDQLFRQFADSILVLSYSSNGYPDLEILCKIMKQYKKSIDIYERTHRYHFGTHSNVKRSQVQEYLIIGH